jgi:hypothetical protein
MLGRSANGLTNSFWFNLVLWMVISFAFMLIFQNLSKFHWPTAGAVAFFFVCVWILAVFNVLKQRKVFAPSDEGVFVGSHRFLFDEEGIHSEGIGYKSFHHWGVVKATKRDAGMIMVFIDTALAFVFPEDRLDDPETLYHALMRYQSLQQAQSE